jgi:hypothetical protein
MSSGIRMLQHYKSLHRRDGSNIRKNKLLKQNLLEVVNQAEVVEVEDEIEI